MDCSAQPTNETTATQEPQPTQPPPTQAPTTGGTGGTLQVALAQFSDSVSSFHVEMTEDVQVAGDLLWSDCSGLFSSESLELLGTGELVCTWPSSTTLTVQLGLYL